MPETSIPPRCTIGCWPPPSASSPPEAPSRVTLKRIALEADLPAEEVLKRWSSAGQLLAAAVGRLTEDLDDAGTCERVPVRGGELSERQSALLDQAVHLLRARARLDQIEPLGVDGRFPIVEQLIDQFVARGTTCAPPATAPSNSWCWSSVPDCSDPRCWSPSASTTSRPTRSGPRSTRSSNSWPSGTPDRPDRPGPPDRPARPTT